MKVKNISTRVKICGRSANCTGGHSAVKQSAYISREKMYCEYDGQTYYPKYAFFSISFATADLFGAVYLCE